MTVEQLMQPRYKVIGTYPNSIYKVGAIIEGDGKHFFNTAFFETYPHLFRKLEWWQERKPEDMPEYVKIVNGTEWSNGKVIKVEKWSFYKGECLGISYYSGGGTMVNYLEPATEQEYLSFIKTTQP